MQLTFNNLKTDGSSTLASFGERVGNQKLSLEKMTISVEGKELARLEGMEISGKSDRSMTVKRSIANWITR